MPKRVIELPFLRGQDEGTDPKLLASVAPQGTLKRAVNVRLRKDGRLGTRRDYTALSMTTYGGGTLAANDLVNFDGRLVVLGDASGRGFATDIYEYVNSAFAWSATEGLDGDKRITSASALRDMGRLPSTGTSQTVVDVAATNGIVCVVSSDSTQSFVHVFRADTGQTLIVERSTTLLFMPRVVAIGSTFFIAGLTSAGTSITLRSFTPATNSATQALATPFVVAAAIVAWDMTTNVAETELVMAVARTGPTTQILRVSTAGTTLQTIAGPATLEDFVTVINDGTRIHFVDVVDTTRICRISTYTVATGLLQSGPTTLFGSDPVDQQATVGIRSATHVRVSVQVDQTTRHDLPFQDVNAATHALDAVDSRWDSSFLITKNFTNPAISSAVNNFFFGGRFLDPDCTNYIGLQGSEQILASKEHYTSAETLLQLPHLAEDNSSGKIYWAQLVQDVDGNGVPLVSEFVLNGLGRLQTASIGGHLYLAASTLLVYDGKEIVESGYPDIPVIISVASSNGAGTLTPLGLYSVAVTWEKLDALGHLHTSAPSEVEQVTLGASDDTITIVVTTPHSQRRNVTNETFGSAVKVIAWCTEADGTVLQRAAIVTAGQSSFGNVTTLTILGPDSFIAEQEVLYTQGSRGALSGPLAFETALPSRYVWASKERLLLGGQPYGSQIQESRPLFPNEPVQWSLGLGFFATVRGDVTAVAILDEQRVVFTRDEIFIVPGEGIDDTGNGTFGPAVKLPSECGCIDWRSLCEIGAGLLFQGDTDKIYLLPRGGGAPKWIGQPVRDTLAAFPVITSATFCVKDQTVAFTCNDTGGTTGRILVYDTRAQAWYVDEPLSAETYRSSCTHDGVLVLAKGTGLVFQQQTTEAPTTFIPVELETPDIFPGGNDGWAQIYGASVLCEFRGNCVLSLEYSLDCGVNYVAARTYSLSGLAVGSRVRRTFTFGPFQAESIRLRFRTAALAGAATAGLAWNSYGIFAEPIEGLARVSADSQG